MATDREPTQEWLTVGDAARALGVSDEAVRQKAKRRTIRSMKGNDGRLRVLIDTPSTQEQPKADQPKATQESTGELNVLRTYAGMLEERLAVGDRLVDSLRAEHAAERERMLREIDRIRSDMGRLTDELMRGRDGLVHERQRNQDLVGALKAANLEHSSTVAELRTELAKARPWWRRLIGR
jgi:hypothetical protein